MHAKSLIITVAAALLLNIAAHAQTMPDYNAIVAAPDRSADDHKLDQYRAPAKLLAFTGAKPSMKVLDVFAVNGYKAELLARAVAPGGKVYAQNSERAMGFIGAKLQARLKTPAAANIVSFISSYDDPIPPGEHDFDLVTFLFAYHDVTYLGVDRPKMLNAIYTALKRGGIFVVADYSAKPGAGTSAAQPLHRSDEALARSEIEAAGFKFVAEGDFLRNPNDPRTEHSHSAGNADAYILKFQKP